MDIFKNYIYFFKKLYNSSIIGKETLRIHHILSNSRIYVLTLYKLCNNNEQITIKNIIDLLLSLKNTNINNIIKYNEYTIPISISQIKKG